MTDTRSITIAGNIFEIPVRYAEGHALTAGEAKAMNQTYAENIGNALRKKVEAGAVGQAEITAYANEYQFTVAGPSRARIDPVEREARKLAKETIRVSLEKKGRKLSDVDKEALAEKVANLALEDRFMKQAKKNVESAAKLAAEDLEEFDLPDAPTEE